jgi:hypothetical protein
LDRRDPAVADGGPPSRGCGDGRVLYLAAEASETLIAKRLSGSRLIVTELFDANLTLQPA